MPKLASFTADLDPSPVTGWWNTDRNNYDPPPPEPTIELTEEEWEGRLTGGWAVSDGKLVAYTPPPTPEQIVADKIAQGLTLQPAGVVLSLAPRDIEGLRLAALDASAGLGLPLDAETFDAVTTTGTIALNETQVIAVYRAARNLRAGLGHQVAIMKRGEEPKWVEQTLTLEP
jgi:hypothetical protein